MLVAFGSHLALLQHCPRRSALLTRSAMNQKGMGHTMHAGESGPSSKHSTTVRSRSRPVRNATAPRATWLLGVDVNTPSIPSPQGPEHVDVSLAFTGGLIDLAFQAYLWGYPAVVMNRTKNTYTSESTGSGVPVNTFRHFDGLATPMNRIIVKPNNDTLYSSAWLDLSRGPLILSVPDTDGRYYCLDFLDAYTNVWAYIGRRTTGTQAGQFVVVGPNWTGDLPDLPVLNSPTDMGWLHGRTLVDGHADIPAARELMDQYILEPLHQDDAAPLWHTGPVLSPQACGTSGISFFDELCAVIASNSPPAADHAFIERFTPLGIGPGRVPSQEASDPLVRNILDKTGLLCDSLMTLTRTPPPGLTNIPEVDGWSYQMATGSYGQKFLLRSLVAHLGLGALHPEECLYLGARQDTSGQPLDGKKRYVLRFPAGQLPAVDAFWSLTAYDAEQFLIENPLERYSVGDRTPGLVYGEDGSLELFIQSDEPKQGAENWLPVGDGPFELLMRCYEPRPELLDRRLTIPPLRRLDD